MEQRDPRSRREAPPLQYAYAQGRQEGQRSVSMSKAPSEMLRQSQASTLPMTHSKEEKGVSETNYALVRSQSAHSREHAISTTRSKRENICASSSVKSMLCCRAYASARSTREETGDYREYLGGHATAYGENFGWLALIRGIADSNALTPNDIHVSVSSRVGTAPWVGS